MDNTAGANVAATTPPLPAVDTGMTVLTTLGYLCLLLGVIFLAYYLLRRFGFHGIGVRSGTGGPQLMSRLMLGSRQSVAVVRFRDTDMVVGVTEDRVSLLKEFPAQDEADAPAPAMSFANFLKRSKDDA